MPRMSLISVEVLFHDYIITFIVSWWEMLSRRELIVGVVACAGGLGCDSIKPTPRRLKLGTLESFSSPETVLPMLRLVVRRDELGLSAMSLICTHQGCVVAQYEGGLVCPCHGARFSAKGEVQMGPATRDLPYFELVLEEGVLVANLGVLVGPDWRLSHAV